MHTLGSKATCESLFGLSSHPNPDFRTINGTIFDMLTGQQSIGKEEITLIHFADLAARFLQKHMQECLGRVENTFCSLWKARTEAFIEGIQDVSMRGRQEKIRKNTQKSCETSTRFLMLMRSCAKAGFIEKEKYRQYIQIFFIEPLLFPIAPWRQDATVASIEMEQPQCQTFIEDHKALTEPNLLSSLDLLCRCLLLYENGIAIPRIPELQTPLPPPTCAFHWNLW